MLRPSLLALVLLLVGCERPFIEPEAPTLEILEPTDLGTVRVDPELQLAFRASSFRNVSRVEVNGVKATYLRDEDVYLDTLQLRVGLNTILVDAFDTEGTVGTDTLYAVHLPYGFANVGVQLPEPLGGHTATLLQDGNLLFTGGAPRLDGIAKTSISLLDLHPDLQRLVIVESSAGLLSQRVGHTASLLPDGRVLILGGSRRALPTSSEDFVTTVEIYDPASSTCSEVPLVDINGAPATPIQRTEHTTALLTNEDGEVFVYLYGGLVPRFDGNGVVPSSFMRTLRFDLDDNQLVALGPPERFLFTALSGHTQTPLADVDADGFGSYLVAGDAASSDPDLRAPFTFSFTPSFVDAQNVGSLTQPRTDHAAAPLGELVLVTGGRMLESETSVTRSTEVFASSPAAFFDFPERLLPNLARSSHTATNLGRDRILLVGGFSASGEALDRIELFLPR